MQSGASSNNSNNKPTSSSTDQPPPQQPDNLSSRRRRMPSSTANNPSVAQSNTSGCSNPSSSRQASQQPLAVVDGELNRCHVSTLSLEENNERVDSDSHQLYCARVGSKGLARSASVNCKPQLPLVADSLQQPDNVLCEDVTFRHRRHSNSANSGSIVIPIGLSATAAGRDVVIKRTKARQSPAAEDQGQATIRERNSAMLFSDTMADVYFLVGTPPQQERIAAHTYVLATGSTVFYAMFYGGFPQSGDITVPDVEPLAFRILLRYLYTDEVSLDADTVLPTLYASKKYLVAHLTRRCIAFLENSLTAQNVCLLLTQSRLFAEEQLTRRCWELLDAQAEQALLGSGLTEVDAVTFLAVIGRDSLNADEATVFRAALNWATAECRRRGMETTIQNQRQMLEEANAFEQLRLPAMSIEQFADGPAQSGLLTYREITDVFLWYAAKQKPQLEFVTRRRDGLKLRRCHRFQSSAYRTNQWRYRGRCDSIQFCPDKRIFVCGFGLYGSSNGAAEYKVHLELKRSGEQTLATVDSRFYSDGSSSVFPVFFEQPVQVEAEWFCTASAILEGSELSYFGQEGMPEVTVHLMTSSMTSSSQLDVTTGDDDVINFQFQCSTESTNGTGVQGGQIPEILFYAC